jgi:hypothetical protein
VGAINLQNLKPFPKGVSGNPAGAKKRDVNVMELAKQYTEQALQTLQDVMGDLTAAPSARVSAAQALLDRGWGKPPQDNSHSFNFPLPPPLIRSSDAPKALPDDTVPDEQ